MISGKTRMLSRIFCFLSVFQYALELHVWPFFVCIGVARLTNYLCVLGLYVWTFMSLYWGCAFDHLFICIGVARLTIYLCVLELHVWTSIHEYWCCTLIIYLCILGCTLTIYLRVWGCTLAIYLWVMCWTFNHMLYYDNNTNLK